MCRIDFFISVQFFEKTRIQFEMSVVWFGSKQRGLVRILQLFTTRVIAE